MSTTGLVAAAEADALPFGPRRRSNRTPPPGASWARPNRLAMRVAGTAVDEGAFALASSLPLLLLLLLLGADMAGRNRKATGSAASQRSRARASGQNDSNKAASVKSHIAHPRQR
jgi:hypothetical protein